jgi:hypothetical protein
MVLLYEPNRPLATHLQDVLWEEVQMKLYWRVKIKGSWTWRAACIQQAYHIGHGEWRQEFLVVEAKGPEK